MKKSNLILSVSFLFVLLALFIIPSISATMYVADNRSLYRSYDNVNFDVVLPYLTPNVSLPTTMNITRDVRNLHTDSSGQYLIFIDGENSDAGIDSGRRIILSSDYGDTYIAYPTTSVPQTDFYKDTAMSKSGQYQYVIVGNKLLRSSDYGLNFVNVSVASTTLHKVSTSDSGQLVSIVEAVGGAGIFISTNYGASFTKYNVLGAGAYMTTCIQDNVVYAIGQSSISSYRNFLNGTGVWTVIATSPLTNTNQDMVCAGTKFAYPNRYSNDSGGNLSGTNSGTYLTAKGNLSQFYATNVTNIIQSTNGLTYTNLKTGFKNLTRIAVSEEEFVAIPNIQSCIDDVTFCNDAFYNYNIGNYSCYYQNVEHCALGCIDDVCYNNQENECDILNSKICSSSTTYSTCFDADNDGYFDLVPTSCAVGEYCQASGDYFAYCDAVPQSSIRNFTSLTIIPYSISSNGTSYTNLPEQFKINVNTENAIHIQRYYTMALVGLFSSRTCDYTETHLYSSTQIYNINSSTTISLPSTNVNSKINMLLIPTENVTTLYVRSSINNPLTALQLVRNLTAKSMCVNQLNGTAIYCDYSTNTYDDLSNLNITLIYDFISSSYTMVLLFDRETNNQVYVSPQIFSGTDISSIELNSSDLDVQYVWFNSFTQPNGYTLLQPDDTSYNPCIYDEVGCYVSRTYINNLGTPDYSISKDYTTCINTLSTTTPESDANRDDFFGGDGLSDATKIFIVILIILFILGGFIAVGFATHTEKISIIMGSLLSVMVMILFTVIGWIPVWILIMMIVLALALIIILPSFKEAPSG